MRFVRPKERATVTVMNDNSAAVLAIAKGHSPAFVMNTVCDRIRRGFPHLTVGTEHLAGAVNPADGLSRGEDLTEEDWAWAVSLARDRLV